MNTNFRHIIPIDGEAIYYGPILNNEATKQYFDDLLNQVDWKNEEISMFGKLIQTKRKVAFYADNGINYSYANKVKYGKNWIKPLLNLKHQIEAITATTYNACLLNLYHDGNEGMGWHSDNEKEIKPNSSIASFSIGANRKFVFKHKKTNETISLLLEQGSLLEMKGEIQTHWWHALPKTKKVLTPRINLTFRQILKEKM